RKRLPNKGERALEREATREATRREQEVAKAAANRELEILRLRLELENKREGNRSSGARTDSEGQSVFKFSFNKLLLALDERKDDLGTSTRGFEGIALSQKWPESQWATALSTCLTGPGKTSTTKCVCVCDCVATSSRSTHHGTTGPFLPHQTAPRKIVTPGH
ncbi:hypothetical protein HPB47_014800, partial [Ixodes persulcatus]